jgi:hypothetical protein
MSKTIYLLRYASFKGEDDGIVIAAFTTIATAKEYCQRENLKNKTVRWIQCTDHDGMYDCMWTTFDNNGQCTIEDATTGKRSEQGYAITEHTLFDSSYLEQVK